MTAAGWQAGHVSDEQHTYPTVKVPTVKVSRSIAASAADLWAAISTPGNLEHSHPFCERNPVAVWPGRGARDEVHYLSGWVYRREFTNWIEGVGYDLLIGGEGERPSRVSWRIEPDDSGDSGRSSLTITIQPRPLDRISTPLQRPVQLLYVRPLLRRYLRSVVRGVDWYVTTGQPVGSNQFGRHPWFSDR